MCHRKMFARGGLNPFVYTLAAGLRVLMGLSMVTCLFTLIHFFSASGRLLFPCSPADRPTQLAANDFTLERIAVSFPHYSSCATEGLDCEKINFLF